MVFPILLLGASPVLISVEPTHPIIEDLPVNQKQTWTVGFNVSVNAYGRADSCIVTKSSGNSIIDRAGCQSMLPNAKFKPATDGKGNSVSGEFSGSLKYDYSNLN